MSVSDLATAAAEYHARGWPVVPVNADKEAIARFKQWKQRPQTSQEVRGFPWPRLHGLGILTWPYSDLVVLDFDGPHAEQVWREHTGLTLPETATTRTGGGWAHRIYRVPLGTPRPGTRDVADPQRKIRLEMEAVPCGVLRDKRTGTVKACGVDLLLNGYFVVPPTPGYREDPDHPFEPGNIATIPQGILDLARRKGRATPPATEPTDGDWFAAALRGPVLGGGRNDTANKLAFELFKRGLPRHRVTPILDLWAAKACDPPLLGDGDEMKKLRGTIQSAEEAARREATKPPEQSLPILETPAVILRQLRNRPDPIPTGVPVLDERLRGGMRPGKALVIGGTAGAGKTSLGLQIALAAAGAGCAVVCFMADEGREPALIRLGQQLGYIREQIEEGMDAALAGIERDLAGTILTFPDPDAEADTTVEGITEALVQAYPGRPKLLLLDSIQTVHTRHPLRETPTLRERIMENARTARRLAVQHGLILVYTSEVNRGFYRARKEEDRIADLAAFAEARIEFSGDVLLTMRASEQDPYLVTVTIPKNRLGHRAPLLLRLDPARAYFSAVEGDPIQAARDEAHTRKTEETLAEILRELERDQKAGSKGLTRRQLFDLVGGKKAVFDEALRLGRQGPITAEKVGNRVLHRLAEIPQKSGTQGAFFDYRVGPGPG